MSEQPAEQLSPEPTTAEAQAAATAKANYNVEGMGALVTSFMAVILAINAIFSGQSTDDMMVAHNKATNTWSYFQSKSTKQSNAEQMLAQLQIDSYGNTTARQDSFIRDRITYYTQKVERYEKEKGEIEQAARTWDSRAEGLDAQGPYFDMAEALYQIALVISAVGILSKRRTLVLVALLIGLAGIGYTYYAYNLGSLVPEPPVLT